MWGEEEELNQCEASEPGLVTSLMAILSWRLASQVPLVGAKVREKIRHFEENLTVGAQRDHVGKAQAAVPLQPPQPAHLPPSGRISRLARPITPDDDEGAT